MANEYAETHPTAGPDFFIQNEGTIFLVCPQNDKAQLWLGDNVQEDAQWLGMNLAVEHRYILSLVDGIRAAGLTVAGR